MRFKTVMEAMLMRYARDSSSRRSRQFQPNGGNNEAEADTANRSFWGGPSAAWRKDRA